MATQWDLVLPRGRTATIPYTVQLGGVADNLTGMTDLRWLAKLSPTDGDRWAVITKTYLNGGLSVVSLAGGTVQVTLTPADTAVPAISANPGTVVLYLGLVLYLPGTPEVEYDLFGGTTPTLLLTQGVVQAIT
jgi:hypothetical protein